MSNDKTKIGVLVPAGNLIHEEEFGLLAPDHIEFHFQGFAIPAADSPAYCDELKDCMQEPIRQLRQWGADAILIGCTAASMRCGDKKKISDLEELAGVPITTAAKAISDALQWLSITSLAIATPYGDKGNQTVADFVRGLGIDVVSIKGLEFDSSPEVWKKETNAMTPGDVIDFVMSLDIYDADAIFLPCTGLRSLETLQKLESTTDKRALSSVQAGYWAALNTLGIQDRKPGFGKLIEDWHK